MKNEKKSKKWKNGRTEKSEKMKKWKNWIQTQNPLRFPRFTVVVVTFFRQKSKTISMILFRNVSLSRGKSTTRFGVSPFFRRKVTIFIGRETKIHILPTKIDEKKSIRSAHLTIIFLLEQYNHSTTTTVIQTGEAPF